MLSYMEGGRCNLTELLSKQYHSALNLRTNYIKQNLEPRKRRCPEGATNCYHGPFYLTTSLTCTLFSHTGGFDFSVPLVHTMLELLQHLPLTVLATCKAASQSVSKSLTVRWSDLAIYLFIQRFIWSLFDISLLQYTRPRVQKLKLHIFIIRPRSLLLPALK